MGLSHFRSKILILLWTISQKCSDSEQLFLHPEQQQSCLIFIIRDLDSLNSGFLCYKAKHSLWSCYLSLHITLWQTRLRDSHKSTNSPDTAIGMINKLSFVSDPWVSRLTWASMKWQLLSRTKPDPRTDTWQWEREERIEPSSSDFCFSLFYPSR